MSGLRRQALRLVTRVMSARMDSIASIPELRAFAGAGSKGRRLPRGATACSAVARGVPVEWITPAVVSSEATILYLHGGGWVLGWYNSHRWMVASICAAASCRALAVDYRLAPEDPFPAALKDCLSAYRWLIGEGTSASTIVLAGDSAGGNLVLSVMMALRDAGDPMPAAAVCISAMTDLAGTGDSLLRKRDALLSAKTVMSWAGAYVGDQDPRTPLISPLYGDFAGLPPLLVQAGADEILLSDSLRLAERAGAAGVDVRLSVWPGMWHVWHTLVPYLPEAQDAVSAIGAFVDEVCPATHSVVSAGEG